MFSSPNGYSKSARTEKFGVALSKDLVQAIAEEAVKRGISVQALIRAVIIPDWVRSNLASPAETGAERFRK